MKCLYKRGANALGLLGIMLMIIIFEAFFTFFYVSITNDNVKNVLVQECKCGIGGCSVYMATHSFNEFTDLCSAQAENNPAIADALSKKFFTLPIIIIIGLILNITLVLVGLFYLRGVEG